MIFIRAVSACFLFFLSACVDYMKIDDQWGELRQANMPPIINKKYINPHPSRLIDSLGVGTNCKGQAFMIPPIDDYNTEDRLYYTWFLDNKLVAPQSLIEPENRDSAVISLHIDEAFLLSHYSGKMPKDFFNRPHFLEFDVLDVPYSIPESRYIENKTLSENKHADNAYWIILFSNDPC